MGALLFVPFAALGAPLYALTVAALTCVGIWAAEWADAAWGTHDDGRIVIDEVAGQLVTLAPLVLVPRAQTWPWVVTGFVVFRVLDITKPGPVRWAERRLRGGAGVVMDDVVAGALGAVVLGALLAGWSLRAAPAGGGA